VLVAVGCGFGLAVHVVAVVDGAALVAVQPRAVGGECEEVGDWLGHWGG
jgi:hypothetical protein